MNTWIWHRIRDDGRLVTYKHGPKTFTFPRRMLVSVPQYITDADVADLKAAMKRDKIHA